ncbi:leucyl/phenylalanyl-tRNA--protein transferase [Lichenicoccus sp.]|uniref:leucyl/phenylalanyl-tRNA--protein transferase n=1 Tax=Lichenicoccus sp. TaxID=2781899 RepID=UPI003D0E0544
MFRRRVEVTPELLLRRYRDGLFPMAETRDATELFWLDPEPRGILPLDRFHLPRRLRRTALAGTFETTTDRAFEAVIDGCAGPAPGREESWINPQIRSLFLAVHRMGSAHSIECWREGTLCGGLYGIAIGGAFFGESMFSRQRDASKVALAFLVARLRLGGFRLLDTQFITSHLSQFGAVEVSRARYRGMLADATAVDAQWQQEPADLVGAIRRLGAACEDRGVRPMSEGEAGG